jgi:hypothetical protein
MGRGFFRGDLLVDKLWITCGKCVGGMFHVVEHRQKGQVIHRFSTGFPQNYPQVYGVDKIGLISQIDGG